MQQDVGHTKLSAALTLERASLTAGVAHIPLANIKQQPLDLATMAAPQILKAWQQGSPIDLTAEHDGKESGSK